MAALLVIAHAPLASSLRAVAAHVYPDCNAQLAALDVDAAASPEQTMTQVRAALAALGGAEALILVDVPGATPCNVACAMADGVHVRVVAGVNVPMLWRALCYADLPLGELVARAIEGGRNGVIELAPDPRPHSLAPGAPPC
jgi:PTS system mannose-specific IIA component